MTSSTSSPTARIASGLGLATITDDGTVLDVWYPQPMLDTLDAAGSADTDSLGAELEAAANAMADPVRGTHGAVLRTEIDLDAAPADTADAYLRLHLLSTRLAAPNTLNLDGIFGKLPNVVWTNFGPCAVDGFDTVRLRLRARGPVTVFGVDKFPRMTDRKSTRLNSSHWE